VPELLAKPLGRLFLAFANLAAINHHVVLARHAIDTNRTEGKIFEMHTHLQPLADTTHLPTR
jgi:hypothetical protein